VVARLRSNDDRTSLAWSGALTVAYGEHQKLQRIRALAKLSSSIGWQLLTLADLDPARGFGRDRAQIT
jgi:hypothetical protein